MAIDYNLMIKENMLRNAIAANKFQIKEAESKLNVVFSDDYREFLSNIGACIYKGHEIIGICDFPQMNVNSVTTEAREYNPQVPKNLYVIEEPHFDGIYIWQDETGLVYQTYPNCQPQKIASSLAEYLGLK